MKTHLGIHNPITANLLMISILLLGLIAAFQLKRELFPKFNLDKIQVTIAMEEPSSPDEIDRNVVQILQSHLRDIEGVKEIKSTASQQSATFIIDVLKGYESEDIKLKVKDEIDRISTLPEEALEPHVSLILHHEKAIDLALYSKTAKQQELRLAADNLKGELLRQGIAKRVELFAKRDLEISLSISQKTLLAKQLNLQDLAQQIQQENIELTAGEIKNQHQTMTIKAEARKNTAQSLGEIPIRFPNGEYLPLKNLLDIHDDFSEEDVIIEFSGQPAIVITIEKSDTEDIITLCQQVKAYLQTVQLPDGIHIVAFNDSSLFVQGRLDLITSNGLFGLLLVLIVLTLFLDGKTALWTTAGIAFSLIGSFAILNYYDQSINMLSLFGFLMASGIVVDDAIVMSEEFFFYKKQGLTSPKAALKAFKNVSWPILAMVATTVIAFIPLLYVSGMMGKFIAILPVVVIAALSLSLFESLYILPAHHAHGNLKFLPNIQWISQLREKIDVKLHEFTEYFLSPMVEFAIKHRYTSLVLFLGFSLIIIGFIPVGVIKTSLFPKIDSDFHVLNIEFNEGTPSPMIVEEAHGIATALVETGLAIKREKGSDPILEYFLEIGAKSKYKAQLIVQLLSVENGRSISSHELIDAWRKSMPIAKHVRSLNFKAHSGGPQHSPIAIRFASTDQSELLNAETLTKDYLSDIEGVVDIASSYQPGALTAQISIKKEYKNLPLSETELISSIANAYRGYKIDTFYRQDNEVKTYLRTPLAERQNLSQLKELTLKNGLRVGQVADIILSHEESEVRRINGERTLTITANMDHQFSDRASFIIQEMQTSFLPKLIESSSQVHWTLGGEAKEGNESVNSLKLAYLPAILGIYLILATLFRSYIQPLIIMSAIPFGLIGALIGHLIMNIPFSLMSIFGVIALTGVVVNDSLVLMHFANKCHEEGQTLTASLIAACKRRFKPILLTTLTTIACMSPILLETSLQAQFLIPMVTSLVFGLLFSTILILLLIPVNYLIVIDTIKLIRNNLFQAKS